MHPESSRSLITAAKACTPLIAATLIIVPLVHSRCVSADTPPQFTIHLLGFEDPTHTYPDGRHVTEIRKRIGEGMSSGSIAGDSRRYPAGRDAWLFLKDDESFREVGLFHTDPNSSSESWRVNSNEQVVGTTTNALLTSGKQHGWFYDAQTDQTFRIGQSTLEGFEDIEDYPLYLQPDGLAVGRSGYNSSSGQTWAWSFAPQEGFTRSIGLPESVDLGGNAGSVSQTIEIVTPSNLVIGSTTPLSSTANQQAIWVHRPGMSESERIGLYGGDYTRNNGDHFATFDDINGSGIIVGRSDFPASFGGRAAAWLYDSHTRETIAIGLAHPIHADGHSESATVLTESNYVMGTSRVDTSQLNWVYDYTSRSNTIVGLRDLDHTLEDGSTYSEIDDYAESGFVLGISRRLQGIDAASRNTTAWIYNPLTTSTTAAGLNRPRSNILDLSRGVDVNEAGQAIGISYPRLHIDVRPWFFDPQTQQSVQLAPLVNHYGDIRGSSPLFLNESGQVAGLADFLNGGSLVWFYDHGTGETRYGIEHRDEFTGSNATIHALTESGLVLGSNEREIPGDDRHTPWLYDSNTGLTHNLIFSESPSGQALSHISYLSEDGVVLGEYDFYSENDERSRRFFYWSIENGFHDLEDMVLGDLSALGWDSLTMSDVTQSESPQLVVSPRGIFAFDDTLLWAYGTRGDGSEMPFALIRVPEPSNFVLLISALTLAAVFRWHHSRLSAPKNCIS